MEYFKKILRSFIISFSAFILLLSITTLLTYINILSGGGIVFFNLIIPIISILVGSIYLGINSNNNGWLEGLKLGIIISLLFITLNIFLYKSFGINKLIYYFIFLVTSILGGSIGISKRKTN